MPKFTLNNSIDPSQNNNLLVYTNLNHIASHLIETHRLTLKTRGSKYTLVDHKGAEWSFSDAQDRGQAWIECIQSLIDRMQRSKNKTNYYIKKINKT